MFMRCSGIAALVLALASVWAGLDGAVQAASGDEGNESASGFIYLDDGSEPGELPPLFPEDTALAPGGGLSPQGLLGDREAKKAAFFILDGVAGPLLSPALHSGALRGLAEQRASFQIGLGRIEPDSMTPSGLGIWLSSEMMVEAVPQFGLLGNPDGAIGFDHRRYNLGLGVGYDGFSLGASFRQEHDDFDVGYRGFDLGLAYQGRSWFTNIQYAGYRNEDGPLFYSFLGERKLQAFEVGAGYALWPGLTFSGRFKFFDYSNPLFLDTAPDQEHVFTLGTKLNF